MEAQCREVKVKMASKALYVYIEDAGVSVVSQERWELLAAEIATNHIKNISIYVHRQAVTKVGFSHCIKPENIFKSWKATDKLAAAYILSAKWKGHCGKRNSCWFNVPSACLLKQCKSEIAVNAIQRDFRKVWNMNRGEREWRETH